MKTINAKRIAAVAASLLTGLAVAGSVGGVTWSNIPIINNQGQPVVQVVVGSSSAPSDGVVAANIAAVLGNLAFTSQAVTATPSGLSNVKCVVTTPQCTLTNQQVWFGESGYAGPAGSYSFTALIGSMFNAGIQYNVPQNTKSAQASTSYAYPVTGSTSTIATQLSPMPSPWSITGSGPVFNAAPSTSTASGLAFPQTGGSPVRTSTFDNLLQVSNVQLPGLLNNFGSHGETEYLWLTGIPAYDQASSTNPTTPSFVVFGLGGAYQVVFNKPINEYAISKGNTINNAALMLLGRNWTILNYTTPESASGYGFASIAAGNAVVGGKLELAASLTPATTVYVGQNISSSNFTVQLTDLGQPNSAAQSEAAVQVYYKGALTNVTQIFPGTSPEFTVDGHNIFVNVNQTFAGLYAYQKWAKIKLYSNVMNVTSGQVFNKTNADGWNAYLFWANQSAPGTFTNELQSILLINNSGQTATPGYSFHVGGTNFSAWNVNFVGDNLGSNYDPVTFQVSKTQVNLVNSGNTGSSIVQNIANLPQNEPAQLLTVTSSIPNAFSFSQQLSNKLVWDLVPYKEDQLANTITKFSDITGSGSLPINVIVSDSAGNANIINTQTPVSITVTGWSSNAATSATTLCSLSVYAFAAGTTTNTIPCGNNGFNVTGIKIGSSPGALPYLDVNVIASNSAAAGTANTLADLIALPPELLYNSTGGNLYTLSTATPTYNQQNGQPAVSSGFQVTSFPVGDSFGGANLNPYYAFTANEYDVPGSTSYVDSLGFSIYNSTGGVQNFNFQLNQSGFSGSTQTGGTKNNMSYLSSQGTLVNAPLGFITERGSKVAQESASEVTINFAKAVDTLQFNVAPVAIAGSNLTAKKVVGPVGIGQAVPGFANLTVAKVNASCAFTTSSCSISGLSNVTATPSVSSAVVPVSLNTATTPLVVLDSNANQAATLVVVGSKYVNSVAGQVFAQNQQLNSSFGPGSVVVQAYGTNRILVAGYSANETVQAGNQFINDLLTAAGTA